MSGNFSDVFILLSIPFLGTTAGAAMVFFLRKEINDLIQKALLGFASGVMIAASVWSLILPSVEQSAKLGKLAFLPSAIGIALGMAFLLFLDVLIPHLHLHASSPEGHSSSFKRTTMLVLAVTLHNIPEGMAVGVVAAAFLSSSFDVSFASAFALSLGIAIQNFPEGAIISMPLKSEGNSRKKSFLYGTLSGIVEPVSAFLTILLSNYIEQILPYLLSFAAGAMIYVVVEELIPEASEGKHSNIGTIGFGSGFILMMILDIALG